MCLPFVPGVSCAPGRTPRIRSAISTHTGRPAGPGLFTLSENRMLQHYGSLCSPTTSCYGETILLEEGGTGNYNGLLFSAQHQFANHYTSTTNFTWSHCISDNSTTALGSILGADEVPYNRHADRGNCPSADTHIIFNQSLVAETPKFSNHLRRSSPATGGLRFRHRAIWHGFLSALTPPRFCRERKRPPAAAQPLPGADPYCHPRERLLAQPGLLRSPRNPYTFGNVGNNSLFGPGSIIVNTAVVAPLPDYRAPTSGISLGSLQSSESRELVPG